MWGDLRALRGIFSASLMTVLFAMAMVIANPGGDCVEHGDAARNWTIEIYNCSFGFPPGCPFSAMVPILGADWFHGSRKPRSWLHDPASEKHVARTVVLVFLIGGLVWVLFTDLLLYSFIRDPVVVARIETAKGWVFIALSAVLVYAITLRSALRLTRVRATLAAVIDSIADGVVLVGSDRTIMHANPAAVRMLRCSHLGELIGMGASQFARRFRVSNPDGSLVRPDRFISYRVFDEAGTLRYKAVLHPPGGDALVILATAAGVRLGVGRSAEIVVSVMHDITEVDRLDELRDRFFAAAAHSLKTPVTIIKAHAQALSNELSPTCGRSIAAIERQCNRVTRLVENLLLVARARSGTLRLHPTELDLVALVGDVILEMKSDSSEHDLYVEGIATARVYADRERLGLVLRNLIGEAFRWSKPGSSIRISLVDKGSSAEVGVGHDLLSQEERDAMDVCEDYEDMGVSRHVLAMVVEAHGGMLRNESKGSETTVWIQLPMIEKTHERT